MKDLGNGYFVPEKEDIHIGMRIEFKDPRMLDSWDLDPYLEASNIGKAENLIKKGYVRCQYFREFDLLDEGWEKIGENVYDRKIKLMQHRCKINADWSDNYFNIYHIINYDPDDIPSPVRAIYSGYIYSINDYHQLVNLLKI